MILWTFIGVAFIAVTIATYIICLLINKYNKFVDRLDKHSSLINNLSLAHSNLVHHVMQSDAIIIELREDMVIKENLH